MSIGEFIQEHPGLMLGGGLLGAVIIYSLLKGQNAASGIGAPGTAQDLSGLGVNANGQPVVYVPTSTNFVTKNVGAEISNDPNLTSFSTGAIVSNSPLTVNTPTPAPTPAPVSSGGSSGSSGSGSKKSKAPTPPAAPVPPIVSKSVTITKQYGNGGTNSSTSSNVNTTGGTSTGGVTAVKSTPAPTPASKSIKWNYPYTIKSGDTLSGIATNVTNAARAAGAPSNTVITWQQIFGYNSSVITSTANAHGNPIPGGPQNNIFPGEQIWLPTWS